MYVNGCFIVNTDKIPLAESLQRSACCEILRTRIQRVKTWFFKQDGEYSKPHILPYTETHMPGLVCLSFTEKLIYLEK